MQARAIRNDSLVIFVLWDHPCLGWADGQRWRERLRGMKYSLLPTLRQSYDKSQHSKNVAAFKKVAVLNMECYEPS